MLFMLAIIMREKNNNENHTIPLMVKLERVNVLMIVILNKMLIIRKTLKHMIKIIVKCHDNDKNNDNSTKYKK